LSVYGIIFSGWASNSKYAFLGGLRSSAQMISYEVTISFVWLNISLLGESLNLCEIVKKQEESVWFIFPLFPLWIIFFIIVLAETNRAPFDLPEAEAELVAGYNVEYSSIAFALFFLGEYANMALMSSLCTLFFLGGWLPLFNLPLNNFMWFGLKVTFHLVGFIWVRATLPRYRYDQLMKLGWKKLMPITLVFLLISSLMFFYIKVYYVIYKGLYLYLFFKLIILIFFYIFLLDQIIIIFFILYYLFRFKKINKLQHVSMMTVYLLLWKNEVKNGKILQLLFPLFSKSLINIEVKEIIDMIYHVNVEDLVENEKLYHDS
jgi:hypothetical protein